jgi:hypothetical protein
MNWMNWSIGDFIIMFIAMFCLIVFVHWLFEKRDDG